MRVRVNVREHNLDINCGSGSQSFQWLASVVQSRLKQFHVLRKSLETDDFIVTEIRNVDGELINPKDKLYEHSGPSGLVVSATIATSFPVDDWENPNMNDWMQVAHVHSSTGEKWATEIDAWRVSLEEIKKNSGGIGDAAQFNATLLAQRVMPQTARLIKIGFGFTEADVELAFNLDWQGMMWRWLQPNDFVKSKIGDVLKANYSLICNIFAHYAGVGKVGQRFGMTIEEFGHFLHFMKLFNWKEDEESIERVYFKTAAEPEAEKKRAMSSSSSNVALGSRAQAASKSHALDKWTLMTRSHFTEALVAVALDLKYGDTVDVALKALLEGPVTAYWDDITSKYLQYTCADPALKQSFLEYYQLLKQVFHQKSLIDTKFGPRLPATDFLKIMVDSTMIESDQEQLCISSFLQAQLNPPIQLELEYLVFTEFVESASRVALKAIEAANGFTEAKRIRMGFSLIVEQVVGEGSHK